MNHMRPKITEETWTYIDILSLSVPAYLQALTYLVLGRGNNQPATIRRLQRLERFPNAIDAPWKVFAQITPEDFAIVANLDDHP